MFSEADNERTDHIRVKKVLKKPKKPIVDKNIHRTKVDLIRNYDVLKCFGRLRSFLSRNAIYIHMKKTSVMENCLLFYEHFYCALLFLIL